MTFAPKSSEGAATAATPPDPATPHVVGLRPKQPALYLPQLDALRFFAFFAVFVHHNPFTASRSPATLLIAQAGGFGLSLFFTLSAFLITKLLIYERDRTGDVNLRAFYTRRVLRIWPLYFSYLACVALAGIRLHSAHMSAGLLASMVFLSSNFYFALVGSGPYIAHLWSISVEEQFYAVWPGLFRKVSRRTLIAIASALACGSLLWTFLFAQHIAVTNTLWLDTLTESLFFATGALLACLLPWKEPATPAMAALLFAAGVALWGWAEWYGRIVDNKLPPHPFAAMCSYAITALGCALLLVAALRFPPERVPRSLAYLGKISYGLYVLNPLALHLLPWIVRGLPRASVLFFVLVFALTVGMAALSYRFLEKPALRLKARFEVVATRHA